MKSRIQCFIKLIMLISIVTPAYAFRDAPNTPSNIPNPSYAPIIDKAMPAVVNIATKKTTSSGSGTWKLTPLKRKNPRRNIKLGSGIIVDAKRGFIVTNQHVVKDSEKILVVLNDGRGIPAKLIGADAQTDIAVIQIKAPNLKDVAFANSDKVRVGDVVFAMGNPFGLSRSVTYGIVSAVGRSNLGIHGYENFIQTDASINPGNSGGALINYRGELIGINTAIVTPSKGNVGVGFAIPSNMVKKITTQIVRYGNVKRGELGVSIRRATPNLRRKLGLGNIPGVLVSGVDKKSAAAKAGLKNNDFITMIDNKTIRKPNQFRNFIGLKRLGDNVNVQYMRNGKVRSTSLVIEPRRVVQYSVAHLYPALSGAYFGPVSSKHRGIKGIQIKRIDERSRAYYYELAPGDIILSINGKPVLDFNHFVSLIKDYRRGDMIFYVQRGRKRFYLAFRRS